jgi:hypothetical protein
MQKTETVEMEKKVNGQRKWESERKHKRKHKREDTKRRREAKEIKKTAKNENGFKKKRRRILGHCETI